jgi:DNA-directed RNA polymerase specialized sigma24 family protein
MSKNDSMSTEWAKLMQKGDELPNALEHYCSKYRQTVYSIILNNFLWGHPDQAEEWTNQFFLRELERNEIRVNRHKNKKFRSWLGTCVRNFAKNKIEENEAQKRTPENGFVSLDSPLGTEKSIDQKGDLHGVMKQMSIIDADRAYNRSFAEVLLGEAQEELRLRYIKRNAEQKYVLLSPKVFTNAKIEPYAEIEKELGLTEDAVRKAVFDMKKAYGKIFWDKVRDTMDDACSKEEVDEEVHVLLESFAEKTIDNTSHQETGF